MPEYTAVATVLAIATALLVLRSHTALFRRASYWTSLAIIFAFQVVVDGWLTKASAPIVLYDNSQTLGIRVGWNTPIEDYVFCFSLVTLTILSWERGRES